MDLFNEYKVSQFDRRNKSEGRHPRRLIADLTGLGDLSGTLPDNFDLHVRSDVREYDRSSRTEGRHLRRLAAPMVKPKPAPSHEVAKNPVKSNSSSSSKGKTTTKLVKEGAKEPSSRGEEPKIGSRSDAPSSSRGSEVKAGSRGGEATSSRNKGQSSRPKSGHVMFSSFLI